jgi:DNA-binding NtrC family response regulator
MSTIFVCDDDANILLCLDKLLHASGFRMETFLRGHDLLKRLDATDCTACDTILLDVRMPEMDGLQVLKEIRRRCTELPVVIMTGHGTIDDAVQAIKLGASEYITKPFRNEKLLKLLELLLDNRRLAAENRQLRKELQRGTGRTETLIFKSASFREVYDLTLQVAPSDANILILGESGTGKELIASTIHANSPRAGKPFVSLNCAALTETLLESQLFGHVRGAFTGAIINQKGLIEEADGGTLFLDEIGDVSPAMQAKLLRVVQEKDFIAVGSTHPRKVDVRFVAATNKDLLSEVREGRFREDLYYRLNVININLPPLRERREDIEPLANHFLRIYNARIMKEVTAIDYEALQMLLQYDWPGNVRELENVMERAVILARSSTITAAALPMTGSREPSVPSVPSGAVPLVTLDEVERRHIEAVLKQTGFHKSRTAEILGVTRKTLDRKIAEYGLT